MMLRMTIFEQEIYLHLSSECAVYATERSRCKILVKIPIHRWSTIVLTLIAAVSITTRAQP